jgi:ketosteroid isomerase-like protein
VPDGILATAYGALAGGDRGPLLALIDTGFEWIEPELAGYPLSGVHRGAEAVDALLTKLSRLLDGLVIEAHELAEAGERETVVGVMRGRPPGGNEPWELPFAHFWEVDEGGRLVNVRTYFDRSRLTLAAARRELADVADDLLEQATAIRRQWDQLAEAAGGPDAGPEAPGEEPARANARLAAVDMAQEGATRDEVEAFLRDELGVDDPAPILDDAFGRPRVANAPAVRERATALEAPRISRLFARNRG